MATRAKAFQVGRDIQVEFGEPVQWIRTGPRAAAPQTFTAMAETLNPHLRVTVSIYLPGGDFPVITRLAIEPGAGTPVTSATMRGLLIDPLIRAVVKAASRRTIERPDVGVPGAFQVEGWPSEGNAWVSRMPDADEKVRLVAVLYRDALARGSRSPAADAASAMSLSRPQIARYVRRAREAGLIPPVSQVVRRSAP